MVDGGCGLARLFGAFEQRGLVVVDLRSAGHRPLRPPRTFFDSASLLKPRLAQQSLTAGIVVGLLVAVEMREHQGGIRCKRAANVRGLAVAEIVEALVQRLTVNGDMALSRRGRLLVKDGGVAPEHLLDRSGIQLLEPW